MKLSLNRKYIYTICSPKGAILVSIAILVCALVAFNPPTRLDGAAAIIAAIALFISFIPIIIFFISPRKGRLPFVPLCSAFYILFFILPLFLTDYVFPPGTPAQIYTEAPVVEFYGFEAVLPILLGVSAMVGGMALGGAMPRFPVFHLPEIPDTHFPWVMRTLLILHMSFYLIPHLSRIPSFAQLGGPSGILGFSFAVIAWNRRVISPYEAIIIFCLLLPIRLSLGLMTTSLNNALVLVAVLIILAAVLNRRLLLPVLGLVAAGMLAYAPMKVYRHYALSLPPDMAAVERVKAVGSLWAEGSFINAVKTPVERKSRLDGVVWPLLKRMDQATVLAIVVERTGRDVDPWGGTTLVNLVTGIVPRFIWPEKPVETYGNEFGRRYQILRSDEFHMSVNIPWLTEFYANFMLPGVVIGMFLVGLMFQTLDQIFNYFNSQGAGMAFAATFLLPLAAQESNISLMISNLPLLGGLFWCFLYLSARLFRIDDR